MRPVTARVRSRILSRRTIEELAALQASVHALGGTRDAALRRFVASRRVTTPSAQREFWLEFSWLDQEYRAAVRRLAEFCLEQEEGAPRRLQIA
jgi:hypothetical protein